MTRVLLHAWWTDGGWDGVEGRGAFWGRRKTCSVPSPAPPWRRLRICVKRRLASSLVINHPTPLTPNDQNNFTRAEPISWRPKQAEHLGYQQTVRFIVLQKQWRRSKSSSSANGRPLVTLHISICVEGRSPLEDLFSYQLAHLMITVKNGWDVTRRCHSIFLLPIQQQKKRGTWLQPNQWYFNRRVRRSCCEDPLPAS